MTSVETPLEPGDVAAGVLHASALPAVLTLLAPATVAPVRRLARAGSVPWHAVLADVLAAGLSWSLVRWLGPTDSLSLAVLVPVWAVLLLGARAYADQREMPAADRISRVLRAGAALGLICWAATTLTTFPARPDQLLFLTGALLTTTVLARGLADVLAARTSSSTARTRVLVAGDPDQVMATLAELRRAPTTPFEVVGVCVTGLEPHHAFDVPVRIGLDQLAETTADTDAEAVVVLPHADLHSRALQRLGWALEAHGARLYLGTGLLDVAMTRTSLTCAGGLRLLRVRPVARRGPRLVAKEVWERTAAGLALLLLLPALIVVAVLIRRGSSGSAIFRQQRIGLDGRPFTMLKFRTMTTDAEVARTELLDRNDGHGVLFKVHGDPRITAVGHSLRRYSLDELPQLVNVVRGQMALVGPRPALPAEVDNYDHDPRRRLVVKPGLTGLWQISGRSDLSWEDSVRLDLHYVDNWSLALDLSIVLRTLAAVVGHKGAY